MMKFAIGEEICFC